MEKQYFIEKAKHLVNFENSIATIDKALGGGTIYEGFLGDMCCDISDLLITGVNPNLNGIAENYFYETFCDLVSGQGDEEAWGDYYDALKENKVDPEYIEIFGKCHCE